MVEQDLSKAWDDAEEALPDDGWLVVSGSPRTGYGVAAYRWLNVGVPQELGKAAPGPLLEALADIRRRLLKES